jgi:amino acid transporter
VSVIDSEPGAAQVAAGESGKLHRRALGVPDLVFFIVAASAPLTAVAGGQATTYLVTGNQGVPFMFIPLGVMLALFAVGYAAMSRHVTNAGAFYAYVARGLGKVQAVGAAFVALIAYNAMQIGIYGLFGVAMGAFMADKIGIDLEWYWWCLIGGGVIGLLGVLQIDLNARVLAVLLILEVVVVALFDLAILADPGPQGITGTGFDPGIAFGTAVGATLTFCVASFVGFESAAIYSEEVRDPKRTVAQATFIAIGLIAVFYALSSWLVGIAAARTRSSTRSRWGRRASARPTRPTRRPCCSSPAGTAWARSGATPRRCCSRRACSRRCCRSTTPSRATRSRWAASGCCRRCSATCRTGPARRTWRR